MARHAGAANPAFGVRVTVDDYGKFLNMVLHDGVVNGTACCPPTRCGRWSRIRCRDYDTTHDYSVGITGIPRYGFGCWPDVQTRQRRPRS